MGALVDSSGVAVKLACTGYGVNDRDIRISTISFSQLSGHTWLFCGADRKEDSSGWTQRNDSLPGHRELLEQLIERLTPGESIEKPTPIEAGGESTPEPTASASPTEIGGMEIGAMVRHRQHGKGTVERLFASSFSNGNAGVASWRGQDRRHQFPDPDRTG